MQVSKKSQYGLRAMVYLAKNFKRKKIVPIKDIADIEAIPFDFLEKIFSNLEGAGLVKGKKGIGGGYVLSRAPKKITVGDIVKVLEKTTVPVNCALCGRTKKCAAKSVWAKVELAINKTLDGITLEKLIK